MAGEGIGGRGCSLPEQRLLEICVVNAEITVSTSKVFGLISTVCVASSLEGDI